MLIEFFYAALVFIALLKLFNVLTTGWCKSNVCLLGKTALIIGGNKGIGYQAVLGLASRGCRVIIADVTDATETRERVINETGNRNISTRFVDFMSFKSVRNFAKEFLATEDKLDILISNVGIGLIGTEPTEDGLHKTMQVSYFSHFLLTHLLIDLLKKSAPSRIIFTTSIAAFHNELTVDNLTLEGLKGNPKFYYPAYFNAKMCLIIAAQGFAARLAGTGVTCNVQHPGSAFTDIYGDSTKNVGVYALIPYAVMLSTILLGKSQQAAAQTMLHLACAKEVENVSGEFFMDCISFWKPPKAYNKEFCTKIWLESEKIVKLEPHEKLSSDWK